MKGEVLHSIDGGAKAVKNARVKLTGLVSGKPFSVERQTNKKWVADCPCLLLNFQQLAIACKHVHRGHRHHQLALQPSMMSFSCAASC